MLPWYFHKKKIYSKTQGSQGEFWEKQLLLWSGLETSWSIIQYDGDKLPGLTVPNLSQPPAPNEAPAAQSLSCPSLSLLQPQISFVWTELHTL